VLNNPTTGQFSYNQYNPFPSWPTTTNKATPTALVQAFNSNVNNVTFKLDGRWLHAFNGPGMGTQFNTVNINYGNYTNLTINVPFSAYGNFRYNGVLGVPDPNVSRGPGMDEDYDACDLENWFLALQSADGQVTIPSFHRPGIVRYQDAANPMDWDRS